MPQSDFKILFSKMLAALTVLPLQIFGALAVTGVVLYVTTALTTLVLPSLAVPGIAEVIPVAAQVLWFSFAYAVLALLWYAPFFAWIGMLSTVVGRWSIPLAFLIPGLVVLGENLVVRGISDFFIPEHRGGVVLAYLRQRSSFRFEESMAFEQAFTEGRPLDIVGMLGRFVAQIDWVQMGGGLIVATLFIYLASEYRRRLVLT